MKKTLKGHRAVVTGASSGLGESFATQLAALGSDLVIAARRVERLRELAARLEEKHGVRVESVEADLTAAGAPGELFKRATAGEGKVTILINNAGSGAYGRFIEEKRDRHIGTVQLNTLALTELCHLFSTHMLEHSQRSYIANVGSIASFQGVPNFAVYSATKAYVRVFSEILSHELQGTNVTVTCVCPGGTHTEFSAVNGQVLKEGAESLMMTADEVVSRGLKAIFAGQTVVIPGLLNKLACFAPRLLPSGFSLTIAGKAMDWNVGKKGD